MSHYAVNIGVISNEVKTHNGPAFVEKCLDYLHLITDFQHIPQLCQAKRSIRGMKF